MKPIKSKIITVVLLTMLLSGCTYDMNLQNDNNPETKRVIVSNEDLEGLIAGTFLSYWHGWQYWYPSLALSALGDAITCSWG